MVRTASLAISFSVFITPIVAHAQLAITEIMYDLVGGDTGREWIEVQNIGAEPVALTEWKLFEANSNHGLTTEASDALAPGQFAIIADDPAKFRADWPNYSGLVMNSSFSLNNTGESLALRCCGKDASDRDTVSYTADGGAAGDGNSLHRNGGGWSVGAPSPGSGAVLAPIVSESPLPPAESGKASEAAEAEPQKKPGGAFTVEAGGNRSVLAKSAIPLSGRALTSKKEPIEEADFTWNFGDGRTGNGRSIMHAWGYPGKYHVTLRVSYQGESALDTFVVDVSEPDFSVIRFDDGSIGIRNDGAREADISRWRVQEDGKNFVLPDGTIILRNALLRLSPETLGFIASRAALHYPDGVLFARSEEVREEPDARTVSHVVVPMLKPPPMQEAPEMPKEMPVARKLPEIADQSDAPPREEQQQVPAPAVTAQTAAVSASDALSGGWHWWLGAFAISLVGAIGMFALRRPKDEWVIEDGDGVE